MTSSQFKAHRIPMTGSQLKAWRVHCKLSKKRAADALEISVSFLDTLERGHRRGNEGGTVTIKRHISLACAALALGVSDYQGPS